MGATDPVSKNVIHTIVRLALTPLVRLLLRYGVAFTDLTTILQRIYVEVAAREFPIEGRKQSVARVAVLTGLTRREVKRLMSEDEAVSEELDYNRAGRVASAWMRDKDFWGAKGQPSPLSTTSDSNKSFNGLVKKYGGDIPARAVLDELVRQGAVRREGDLAYIESTGYVPSDDSAELLTISFRSVGDLISTIDHNDQNKNQDSRLQLTVGYDNLSAEGAEAFRILSREKSKELLIYLDRFLVTQDRDSNPAIIGDGKVRTGLSMFYFEENEGTGKESGD